MSEYLGNHSEHSAYLASRVCRDHENELASWLEDIRDKLETATSWEEVKELQGCAKTCRYCLGMPRVILDVLEETRDGNERK